MPLTNDSATPVAEAWDTYWRGARDGAACSGEGANHPALPDFWRRVLEPATSDRGALRIVDLACGNGAVEACVRAAPWAAPPELYCLDVSEAAVHAASRRFTGARGIVADACALPLLPGGFALVTSQFGIEYAGPTALAEAARVTAPGGRIALLLHHREGSIFGECSANHAAVKGLQVTGFIPMALRMCEAGFAGLRNSDPAPYQEAAARLQPAYRALEALMQVHGQHVAADTILRLYNDVARIQRNLGDYDPKEVTAWLRRMESELRAYAARMSSMRAAALTQEAFKRWCATLTQAGFALRCAEPLRTPNPLPLAWALIAERH